MNKIVASINRSDRRPAARSRSPSATAANVLEQTQSREYAAGQRQRGQQIFAQQGIAQPVRNAEQHAHSDGQLQQRRQQGSSAPNRALAPRRRLVDCQRLELRAARHAT